MSFYTKKRCDSRHRSGSELDIGRNYDKLVYWLYDRQDARHALSFANRLSAALETNPNTGEIFAEDCRSLICEARGDLPNAIKHREKEIKLINQLHELAKKETDFADIFLGQYSFVDLRDSLDALAMLYKQAGNVTKAVKTLRESKALCKRHRIKFDSANLLKKWESIASKPVVWAKNPGVRSGFVWKGVGRLRSGPFADSFDRDHFSDRVRRNAA